LSQRGGYFLLLVMLGAGWGLTQPLTKIAVSTGYQPLGLMFWQLLVTATVLLLMNVFKGLRLPLGVPYLWRYALIALVGTVIPNGLSYAAAVHLPSGFLSIVIALMPMFSLPLALAWGLEGFSGRRILGVLCGATAIILLAGPSASLPDKTVAIWVLILTISPFMYALEGSWVSKFGILDLAPEQLLLGASVFGILVVAPMAWFSGQWISPTLPMGGPEWALVASAVIHALMYTAYVWLVGRAGSVFASQVSYLVTGFGVFWAILLLGETYGGWVWGAVLVMLVGLFLVQPKTHP
jgi:drug/metabolite transporter (DMT)-like permease